MGKYKGWDIKLKSFSELGKLSGKSLRKQEEWRDMVTDLTREKKGTKWREKDLVTKAFGFKWKF